MTNFLNAGSEWDATFADAQKILANQAASQTAEANFATKVFAAFGLLVQLLDDQTGLIKADFAALGASQADDTNLLKQIFANTTKILAWATPPGPPVSASSDFGPPIRNLKTGELQVNYNLLNDKVVGPITINLFDDQGTLIPTPAGVSFASTVDDPTGLNVVDNDGTHFTINALKRGGTFTITHHDSSGTVPDYTDTINVGEDFAPDHADSDFGDAPVASQAVPAS
jgi:hypothetical protein